MAAYPSFSKPIEVTDEDFNLFHSIDRTLYTILVVNLGRDPAQAMQIMALWLWFERAGHCRHLVKRMLNLPLTLISTLADEAAACLACIERDVVPPNCEQMEMVLTQQFARTEISLRYFYENRVTAIQGVTQIVNEVCSRAFRDILQNILNRFGENPNPNFVIPKMFNSNNMNNNGPNNSNLVGSGQGQSVLGPILGFPVFGNPSIGFVPYLRNDGTNVFGCGDGLGDGMMPNIPPANIPHMAPMNHRTTMEGFANAPQISPAFDELDLVYQRHVLNNKLHELLSNLHLTDVIDTIHDEERSRGSTISPNDRTIFLTFSKGYPISECEVREFFRRRFGDCIEAIFMQEVEPDEQVLYARLVVRSPAVITAVLRRQTTAKYTINGKHVWARKYVKKQNSGRSRGASTSGSGSGSGSGPGDRNNRPPSPRQYEGKGKGILREY